VLVAGSYAAVPGPDAGAAPHDAADPPGSGGPLVAGRRPHLTDDQQRGVPPHEEVERADEVLDAPVLRPLQHAPLELAEVTLLALAARERTGGRFDPTVHDAVVAAGYNCSFDEMPPDGAAISPGAACGGRVTVNINVDVKAIYTDTKDTVVNAAKNTYDGAKSALSSGWHAVTSWF